MSKNISSSMWNVCTIVPTLTVVYTLYLRSTCHGIFSLTILSNFEVSVALKFCCPGQVLVCSFKDLVGRWLA